MKYTINLLPQPEQTVVDKIVYFAFHYLRYILVITQFVVICVFFYRFRVDQEIVDLKDGLQQKRDIISATSTLLDEVEVVDRKITIAKGALSQQDSVNEMLTYFLSRIPQSFLINDVTIVSGTVRFSGQTQDIDSIQVFYDTLKAEKRFQNVVFESVNRTVDSYSFSFQLQNFTISDQENET